MDFLIVTGLSGSGKSRTMDILEDIGYFCVDNVPPQLLEKLSQLNQDSGSYAGKMAVAVDTRSREAFSDLAAELEKMDVESRPYKILFIDADDDTIFNRYREHRRKHPLMNGDGGTLEEAIAKEREVLSWVKDRADYYVDTTHTSVSQLRSYLINQYSDDIEGAMSVQVMSFGFKYGLPMDADMVFDVRSLPNPYYVKELRPRTGLEADVRDYVMSAPESQEYLEKIIDMLDFLHPMFIKEGKSTLVIAIGCTGGMHRSVAFTHAISEFFLEKGAPVIEIHRDKDKAEY